MRETVMQVLAEVGEHHEWQYKTYGEVNRPMPDGTGPDVEWLAPVTSEGWEHFNKSFYPFKATAFDIEVLLREEWDYPKDGTPEEQAAAVKTCSWMRLLREEVAEAFASEDIDRLQRELIQVAALAVSWVATIRERA